MAVGVLLLAGVGQGERSYADASDRGGVRGALADETGTKFAEDIRADREYLWRPFLYRRTPGSSERDTPDIERPGPDTANFPNSAFTLPAGRFYFENSPIGFYGASRASAPQYNWELFYRYGVTDNLELRLYTSGLTVVRDRAETVGFGPPTFDLKYHLWDENPDVWIPAIGVEAYVQTSWWSPGGQAEDQVAWSLNADHTLPLGFLFEWNVGTTQILAPNGRVVFEANASWSLQHAVGEHFSLFMHGYHNGASLPRGATAVVDPDRGYHRINGQVMGLGATWTPIRAMQVFGSLNAGTRNAPSYIALFGFALAF